MSERKTIEKALRKREIRQEQEREKNLEEQRKLSCIRYNVCPFCAEDLVEKEEKRRGLLFYRIYIVHRCKNCGIVQERPSEIIE